MYKEDSNLTKLYTIDVYNFNRWEIIYVTSNRFDANEVWIQALLDKDARPEARFNELEIEDLNQLWTFSTNIETTDQLSWGG